MIRVTYSNIPSGSGESTITFHIKTSDDPDNSGNMSIFYPVIDCQYGNVTQRGKQAPIALQCWSGVVSGTGDGNFSPNAAIIREQLAAILARYLGA